jgi:kynurenine formamidase
MSGPGPDRDDTFDDVIFDDALFDVAAVENGAWAPGPYGPLDRRGSYNEATPERSAAALRLLDLNAPVLTFNLSETLFNGFPAFGTRRYDQRLVVSGYSPEAPFDGEILRSRPRGPNRLSSHEERVTTSYNLATKINGLHHCGVGTMFYNGLRGPDIARSWGTTQLDTPGWGPPLCTRGLLIDVLGFKLDAGPAADLNESPDGRPLLRDDYRITIDDLRHAIRHQGLPAFSPGDAVLIRTGWRHLIRTDPERYLRYCPGPFLAECRWLATFRPAVVGSDTWAFETIDPAVRGDNLSPCHQELFMRHGIRIAESLQLEDLAAARIDRFVFCHAPLLADGATSSSAPPMALATARRA